MTYLESPGQWEESEARLESVMRTHSSKSSRDRARQLLDRAWEKLKVFINWHSALT